LWGGARGGGNPDIRCLGFPPTLSLPHKGGGDAVARSVSSARVCAAGRAWDPVRHHLHPRKLWHGWNLRPIRWRRAGTTKV